MQGVPESFDDPLDRAEFSRPAHRAGIELYRAHIVRYAFDPHTHEAFGLGAIESGVERFRYRGSDHLAPPESLVLMNPDELHTGRAETDGGWRYRMLYLDPAVLEDVTGERGWWFAQPVRHDPRVAALVSGHLAALWQAPDALSVDGLLHDLLALLRAHARTPSAARPTLGEPADPRLRRSLQSMREAPAERFTLEALAREADLSPFHFLRRFKAAFGVTPHQMLMALRLYRAKEWLAAGIAPAEVAAGLGLVDQAHLTRRFARMYGVTPARYQRQVGARAA